LIDNRVYDRYTNTTIVSYLKALETTIILLTRLAEDADKVCVDG